jgi:hypothetical protein
MLNEGSVTDIPRKQRRSRQLIMKLFLRWQLLSWQLAFGVVNVAVHVDETSETLASVCEPCDRHVLRIAAAPIPASFTALH